MKLQPIVEGHGDVLAVPELLRRLVYEAGYPDMEVLKSIRAKRSELVREETLERYISLARMKATDAILIVFDADDDCPSELAANVLEMANRLAAPMPCQVVIPTREYEAWFLAAIESLKGTRGIAHDAVVEEEPEIHRDAKGLLEQKMNAGHFYVERTDQVALTAAFDMSSAYRSCRSFRHLVKAFGSLSGACGITLAAWPPSHW